MKKRLFALALMLALCLSMALPALAVTLAPTYMVDHADLLTGNEREQINQLLKEISARQDVDVVIVTADTLNGKSARDYADDFFDYDGYSPDGVLLLVSTEDRDWWISTAGYGITAFTDAGLDYIGEQVQPELSDGNYAEAFEIFARQCDAFITQARTGDPYDRHNLPKEPFDPVLWLVIALIVGLVVALIVVEVMRSKLKSVRSKYEASDYVRPGSMRITQSMDIFLYRHVSRRPKPKDTGTHRGSSGRSHGGGGGKF